MRIPRSAALLALAVAAPAAAQQPQPVIAPNENLVVDGVPPIPASLAAEVRRYTESRGAGLVDWHPVRREILISTRFANTSQVHRVAMPMGARTQLTFFDEPVGETGYEPRAGRYFLFTRDVGGNEFAQMYRYDVADGRVTLLTDGGRSQNGGWVWSRAGDRIAYSSTRRNGADRDLYVMDPANPRGDRLVLQVQGGGWGALDWSPDGRRLIVGEYLSVNQANLWMVDVQTGQKTAITNPADTAAWGGAEFTADGRSIVITTDVGSEFQRLALMELATKRVTTLTPAIDWDVES
ncbi:MAG TPA: hypothetical protein VM890_02865, partial [Longimicrobium sp.]|nr:hypothetical protein [Longimicrobium sp.]